MSETEQAALLTRWVNEHSSSLLRICFIQLADRTMAEDALQETFIKAWRAIPRCSESPIRNEKAWLTRIALNVCSDMRRSQWMRHFTVTKAIDSLPPSLVAVQPEDKTLLLDICMLPEKYRQVLILYYYQRLTLQETGEILGIDTSTVFYRLRKAEKCLKRKLTEEVDAT